MDPQDLSVLPWPVLLVQADGQVTASPSAELLLEFAPASGQTLERCIQVTSPSGSTVADADLPWRRSDVPFEEHQVWRDRESGKEYALLVRARTLSSGLLLILDADEGPSLPARRVTSALDSIHQALLSGRSVLPVRDLLRMLVELTCELTSARYGALGVIARDGKGLRDFIYVGISEEEAGRIGRLPEGHGLLGAVIRERRSVRVRDIASDPRSEGVPANHPPMHAFLGVPLRLGDQIYGNFYVAEKQGAPEFTDADLRQLERFSAKAALAVAFVDRAEEESRLLFRAVIEHAPYGIAFYPFGESPPFGNPAAHELLGRVALESDPSRTYDLLYPDGSPVPVDQGPGARAWAGEASLNFEAIVARHDQKRIPTLISAAPVPSEAGVPIGIVLVYQDISSLKELDRLRLEFAAIVAHDMRTPVQSVMLQIEALLRRARGEATWVPLTTLQNMKRSGLHLSRLIGDLLDASRLEAHTLPLDRQVVRVHDALLLLVQRLGVSLAREVIIDARDEPQAYVDPFRLDQVLTNLLENAGKYSRDQSVIRVKLEAAHGGARIQVCDQGDGIAADELPHLFERYFRGQGGKKKARGGLGLGLYITRRLVEAHGGTLTATSTPGVGSMFEIWLPGQPPVAEAEPPLVAH